MLKIFFCFLICSRYKNYNIQHFMFVFLLNSSNAKGKWELGKNASCLPEFIIISSLSVYSKLRGRGNFWRGYREEERDGKGSIID
jgi:hypothetical protein